MKIECIEIKFTRFIVFQRVNHVSLLTVFGFRVYMKVGDKKALFGMVIS